MCTNISSVLQGQSALKHGYDSQQAVFKALDQAIAQNVALTGPGTGLQGLHKEWYERFFYAVNGNMKVFYQAKLQAEIANWSGGNKAYAAFKAVQRQKIVSGKLSTLVSSIFCDPAYFCGSLITDRLPYAIKGNS